MKAELIEIQEGYGFLQASNNDIYFWGENYNVIDSLDIVCPLMKVASLNRFAHLNIKNSNIALLKDGSLIKWPTHLPDGTKVSSPIEIP